MEAGFMGIKSIGYDINKAIAAGCRKNLEHYKIKNSSVKIKNALDIN